MIDSARSKERQVTFGDAMKRGLDMAVAGAVLLILSPLMVAIAALIKLGSAGPIFFRQTRPGKDSRPFEMLKFRTMYDGSDRVSVEVLKQANFGPLHKTKADPRITRIGKFLRRFSLDELPQLINVLRGEMSIVGPRPLLGWEFEDRQTEERMRLAVRPGMTGLWQVSGRSKLSFDEMLKLDLEYVSTRSFMLDIQILFRTLPAVVRGDGAF